MWVFWTNREARYLQAEYAGKCHGQNIFKNSG